MIHFNLSLQDFPRCEKREKIFFCSFSQRKKHSFLIFFLGPSLGFILFLIWYIPHLEYCTILRFSVNKKISQQISIQIRDLLSSN